MAKDTPTKPDDKKTVPAGEEKKNDKAVPGNEPEKADGKTPTPDNVVPLNKEAAAKEAGQPPKAEPDKKEAAPPPEKKAGDKGDPAKTDKTAADPTRAKAEAAIKSAEDYKNDPLTKQAQEFLRQDKAAEQQKKAEEKKQTRAARPPTGIKKEEAPPPEPEKTPEPVEAPRHGEKEEIVHIKLNELFPFKDHPFGVRDDAEMRAMVESVKDKGVTQPAIVRPREDGGYELVSGHRRQKASELAGYKACCGRFLLNSTR